MLSYMLPVENKPPVGKSYTNKGLALDIEDGPPEPPNRKKNISKESSTSSFASDLTSSSTPTGAHDRPKLKLVTNGKQTSLKRVSFGSSKGSMVETLIYESPLQEVPEVSPPPQVKETEFPYNPAPADDDSERSKVRVSFYQGARPQCLSPPPTIVPNEPLAFTAASDNMTEHVNYNRQVSTESGWDNPFRPDGDLSREADEIVSLIKGGKPITPTPPIQQPSADDVDHKANINASETSPQTKLASPVQASTPKSNGAKNGNQVEVQRSPEPQQAERVTIKKKQKCQCCVIQ